MGREIKSRDPHMARIL